MSGADERRGQTRGQTNESERKEDDGCGSEEEASARGGTRVSCLRIFLVIFSVYLYCPLFIQCPSCTIVCVSVFLFSFLLFPPARSLHAPAVAVIVVVVVVVFVAAVAVLLLPAARCTHSFVRASLSLLTSPPIYSKRCLRSR